MKWHDLVWWPVIPQQLHFPRKDFSLFGQLPRPVYQSREKTASAPTSTIKWWSTSATTLRQADPWWFLIGVDVIGKWFWCNGIICTVFFKKADPIVMATLMTTLMLDGYLIHTLWIFRWCELVDRICNSPDEVYGWNNFRVENSWFSFLNSRWIMGFIKVRKKNIRDLFVSVWSPFTAMIINIRFDLSGITERVVELWEFEYVNRSDNLTTRRGCTWFTRSCKNTQPLVVVASILCASV